MSDVTRILTQINDGDSQAAEQLLPLVYNELRKLAVAKMAQEKPGQTLQATALVHEAYIRLVESPGAQEWENRGHFFAAAAEAMRRILVEQARRKNGARAGGGMHRLDITRAASELSDQPVDLLALHEALESLAAKDPRKAELVKLRFFAGLTNEETAAALGVSVRTVYDDWAYAKCWLWTAMSER